VRSIHTGRIAKGVAVAAGLLCSSTLAMAQTASVLQGRVVDASGGLIAGAVVEVTDRATGYVVSVRTDGEGRYVAAGIPSGVYHVAATAGGFGVEIIEALTFDLGRTVVRDFRLAVGSQAETVHVVAEAPLLDRASAAVGHLLDTRTVQQMPLNGRHFTDLALLVPGSVAPSQAGFSSRPLRGVGALAINTAGNREEAVAFIVNGVSTNNLTFGP
jgi:hypothetical protein